MGDVFIEQLVKKQLTIADIFIKIGVFIVAVLIFLFSLLFLGFKMVGSFALLIGVGALWLAYRIITALNTEYEYIVTNGEIDVDKIMGKRKRRRLLTVKASSFKSFDTYNPEILKNTFTTKIIAATKLEANEAYSATFSHTKFGECLLVFSPEDRIIDEIKKYAKLANKN